MRPLVAVLTALALLLPLAGCGSEEDDGPTPLTEASPTAPPGLDTEKPVAPATQANTGASAVEFATYVARTVQYAIRVRDDEPMLGLAQDPAACSTCQRLAAYIQDLEQDGLWETGEDLRFGTLRPIRGRVGGWRVEGGFTYPEITFVNARGEEDSRQKTLPYRLGVDLSWDKGQRTWLVLDYAFARKEEGTGQ